MSQHQEQPKDRLERLLLSKMTAVARNRFARIPRDEVGAQDEAALAATLAISLPGTDAALPREQELPASAHNDLMEAFFRPLPADREPRWPWIAARLYAAGRYRTVCDLAESEPELFTKTPLAQLYLASCFLACWDPMSAMLLLDSPAADGLPAVIVHYYQAIRELLLCNYDEAAGLLRQPDNAPQSDDPALNAFAQELAEMYPELRAAILELKKNRPL